MGMFSNTESDELRAGRSGGIFGKLKAFRAGLTDDSVSAMSIVGSGDIVVDEPQEPQFRPPTPRQSESHKREPLSTRPMTMGERLRRAQAAQDEDVTDVDVREAGHASGCAAQIEGDTVLHSSTAAQEGVDARGGAGCTVTEPTGHEPQSTSQPRPEQSGGTKARDGETFAPNDDELPLERPDDTPRVQRIGMDLVEPDPASMQVGLPELVSPDSIVFKRILCERSKDAVLNITDAARREFIAVDLQAGVAIVIATKGFHETPLYATYLKDLARADIEIQEEMVATETVIAGIYMKERSRLSGAVPEASRAIGTFRDVSEAAHAYGANDVHWEYRDFNDEVELRFRVNGDLYSYRTLPKSAARRALSAAYQELVQRNTNSGETFQPSAAQSAMIPLVMHADMVNVRWQSAPLVGGFDVGLRILDGNFRNVKVRRPEEMGIEPSQLAIIHSLGKVSGGVTILTGETGSAKSTLLRAMSYILPERDLRKQFAVNEPSEMPQPWLSDMSIQRRAGETDEEANRKCAEVIRTLMRMDPDDVTIGEIRDGVIAGLVAELALTGHPVRTTLHADWIIGAVMRLVGGRLRVPMDEVASERFLNAVGHQKLIPLLCPHCKLPARDVMPKAKLDLLQTKFGLDTSKMACRNVEGCQHCRLPGLFTRDGRVAAGTKGQTLAMELYRPTPEFLDRVAERDWRGAERAWRGARATGFADQDMTGKTIYEHALYKATTGIIDPRFIDESMRTFEDYRILSDRDGRMPT